MNYELLDNNIAKISLDNGKANAVSSDIAQQLMANLDRAKEESKGVLICGHPGMFSAGFDLKVMASGPDAAKDMVNQGMLLLEKMYAHPQPIVTACEGHAIGMGVFLMLAADYRIGASGDFIIKLPETAINMPFNPTLKILAKTHIDALHHSRAIIQSRSYSPAEAATIGMLDDVVDPDKVVEHALVILEELCALPPTQYKENKLFIRADEIQAIHSALHR